jgi:hypothetical protein
MRSATSRVRTQLHESVIADAATGALAINTLSAGATGGSGADRLHPLAGRLGGHRGAQHRRRHRAAHRLRERAQAAGPAAGHVGWTQCRRQQRAGRHLHHPRHRDAATTGSRSAPSAASSSAAERGRDMSEVADHTHADSTVHHRPQRALSEPAAACLDSAAMLICWRADLRDCAAQSSAARSVLVGMRPMVQAPTQLRWQTFQQRDSTARVRKKLLAGGQSAGDGRARGRVERCQFKSKLLMDPAVAFVEPDGMMYPALMPNDPEYPSAVPPCRLIRAPEAWDVTTGSPTS